MKLKIPVHSKRDPKSEAEVRFKDVLIYVMSLPSFDVSYRVSYTGGQGY